VRDGQPELVNSEYVRETTRLGRADTARSRSIRRSPLSAASNRSPRVRTCFQARVRREEVRTHVTTESETPAEAAEETAEAPAAEESAEAPAAEESAEAPAAEQSAEAPEAGKSEAPA